MSANNQVDSDERIEKRQQEIDDKIASNQLAIPIINKHIRRYTKAAQVLFFVGLTIGLVGLGFYFWDNSNFNLDKLGAFIGGIVISFWSLSGTLIIYVSFLAQKQVLLYQEQQVLTSSLELMLTREELQGQKMEMREQNKSLKIQAFENQFFGSVKAQRQMVYEMRFNSTDEYEIRDDSTKKFSTIVTGHRVFTKIFKQLQEAAIELEVVYKANELDLFLNEQIEKAEIQLVKNLFNEVRLDKLKELTICNISYLTVLYGVAEGGRILRNSLGSYYSKKFVDEIIAKVQVKPVRYSIYWDKFVKGNYDYSVAKYPKYYGGHLHRLDQYFRLLFNIVFAVNNNRTLSFADKYTYISFIRTQLTTHEQAVFFLNSLSLNGRQWELKPRKAHDDWQTRENMRLITKYNLIRNLPPGFISNVKFEEYYPLVVYEGKSRREEKKLLISQYL